MRIISTIQRRLQWSPRQYIAAVGLLWLAAYIASTVYQIYKPLPQGLNYRSPIVHADVQFFGDQSYIDAQGQPHAEQQIFTQMLRMINEANSTIVMDMFLFNHEVGASTQQHQQLSQQLSDALIAKKRSSSNLYISVITDPINTLYGAVMPRHLQQLRQHGVALTVTDLRPLRASNPLWSGAWFLCCQTLGNTMQHGWLPNPLGTEPITVRSYLELLNFKANHRKVMITDSVSGWRTLVSTANPHDGSDLHSNVAVVINGHLAQSALKSEYAVANFSAGDVPLLVVAEPKENSHLPQVQLLTEGQIYQQILDSLNGLKRGEQLDLMMFYLSERHIIAALKAAQQRGVVVRVLLDPNKDAFGRQKNGIPNRPVAAELHRAGVPVRWCMTHGEQCHTKMLIMTKADGSKQLILGSANYTARNLKNYNLESDVSITGAGDYLALAQAQQYFDRAWQNPPQHIISADYAQFADESKWHYLLYRLMEWSGISTF